MNTTTEQQTTYRDLLRSKLEQRCKSNAGYSLRAFARDLRLQASQLSRVLNGKQHLSIISATVIAETLFKNKRERDFFVGLVEFETSKKVEQKKRALEKLGTLESKVEFVNLQADVFNVISEWYHFAIMDLTFIAPKLTSAASIGSYLGISTIEAKLALERLERLGLLKREGRHWVKTHSKLVMPTSKGPNHALRHFHKQMINKAIKSIDEQPVEQRYVTGKTMSILREDLPKLQELVQDFFQNVTDLIGQHSQRGQDSNALYQLNVQLFDLKDPKGGTRYENSQSTVN